MIELITLDEYFNLVGKDLFPNWSKEAVHYFSERKNELKSFRKQATAAYAIAVNRIWSDGKVKVSFRLEQGYVDPHFVIEEFDFAHSGCWSADGDYYRCKLEIDKETRGRPREYSDAEIDDVIRDYVRANYISKGVALSKIKHAPVIAYVTEYFENNFDRTPPAPNTIGNHLKNLYPACRRSRKDSNK